MQQPRTRSLLSTTFVIATCTLALMISTVSTTGASISLPRVGRDFNAQQDELQWIISAYALTSGCLLIFMGRLADVYGRRKLFLIGSVWNLGFSIGCGLCKNIVALDIIRAFQGIGSSAMIPAAIGILAHAFPPSTTRSVAFATFAAGAPVGGSIGYLVGGALTQFTSQSWRAVYYLISGLSVLPILGGLFYIDADEPSTEQDHRIDWLGAFLISSGLVLVVFVLSAGETAPQGWKTGYIIATLVLGVVLLGAFIYWQIFLERVQSQPGGSQKSTWTPPPLIQPSLWGRGNGKLAIMMIIAFFNWSCFISWTFWAMLYYQDYLQLSPISTVVRLLPMTVVGLICNVVVIYVISRVPAIYIIVSMTGFTGLAALLFAIIQPDVTYWAYGFPATIVSVAGADFVMVAGSLFVAKVALPHEQSLAGALFQTMIQLGTAFGLTITTVIFERTSRSRAAELGVDLATEPMPADALLKGYKSAQFGDLSFSVASMILAVIFLRGIGIVGQRKADEVDETIPTLATDDKGRTEKDHDSAEKGLGHGHDKPDEDKDDEDEPVHPISLESA